MNAYINIRQYQSNLDRLRKRLAGKVKILAVIKADAYGHGLLSIAKAAEQKSVDFLGVARLSEAVELRSNDIQTPILLFSECDHQQAEKVVSLDITPTVYSYDYACLLNNIAKQYQKVCYIHINVDTGMNRLGVLKESILKLVHQVQSLENISIQGLYTHFSQADKLESNYTRKQLDRFNAVLVDLQSKNISIPIVHAANSDATQNFPDSHYDMVRVGLMTYDRVLSLKSKVNLVKDVKRGELISYNCEYVVERDTKIAVVEAGYADGVLPQLSPGGFVLIHDKRYPVVGRICMDYLIIDVGRLTHIQKGDIVTFLGQDKKNEITLTEICEWTGAIPYLISCSISKRVEKNYL